VRVASEAAHGSAAGDFPTSILEPEPVIDLHKKIRRLLAFEAHQSVGSAAVEGDTFNFGAIAVGDQVPVLFEVILNRLLYRLALRSMAGIQQSQTNQEAGCKIATLSRKSAFPQFRSYVVSLESHVVFRYEK